MKYLGLVNIAFITIVVTLIIKKYKKFKFDKLTYSDLGEQKKIGFWFNLAMIIFAANQVLFALQVSNSEIANIFFFLGGVSLCLVGIFTCKRHGNLHAITVASSLVFVTSGVMILAVNLLHSSLLLGVVAICTTILIPVCLALQKKLPYAKWETLVFLCVVVWNICFSIPLLFP